eukprot:IDg9299t1
MINSRIRSTNLLTSNSCGWLIHPCIELNLGNYTERRNLGSIFSICLPGFALNIANKCSFEPSAVVEMHRVSRLPAIAPARMEMVLAPRSCTVVVGLRSL